MVKKVLSVLGFGSLLAVMFLAVGIMPVNAQGLNAAEPFGGRGGGILAEYMQPIMAEKLGLTLEEYQAQVDAGVTAYQIALDQGLTQDEFFALQQDARTEAIDAALADGAITADQAAWMKDRPMRNGMMQGRQFGGNGANCQPGTQRQGMGMGPRFSR